MLVVVNPKLPVNSVQDPIALWRKVVAATGVKRE